MYLKGDLMGIILHNGKAECVTTLFDWLLFIFGGGSRRGLGVRQT